MEHDPTDPLVQAATAYHAAAHDEAVAGRAIKKAQRRWSDALAAKSAAREPLATAIVEAFKSERWTQAEIIAITKYSRERIRQILREAGVDPQESAERARASRRKS